MLTDLEDLTTRVERLEDLNREAAALARAEDDLGACLERLLSLGTVQRDVLEGWRTVRRRIREVRAERRELAAALVRDCPPAEVSSA